MKRKYDGIRMNGVRKNQQGWYVVAYMYGENKTTERVTNFLKSQSYANKVADTLDHKYDCYYKHAIDIEECYIYKN